MVVGGLVRTAPAPKIVERMFRVAIKMRNYITNLQWEDNVPVGLSARIGIHAGPVLSGVLGTLRGRFHVFGETVIVAEEMEATGVPGKIQVSERAMELYRERAYDMIPVESEDSDSEATSPAARKLRDKIGKRIKKAKAKAAATPAPANPWAALFNFMPTANAGSPVAADTQSAAGDASESVTKAPKKDKKRPRMPSYWLVESAAIADEMKEIEDAQEQAEGMSMDGGGFGWFFGSML